MTILKSCRYVDQVIPEQRWEQKRQDIIEHSVDIFVIGDDWQGKFDNLSDLCKVVYLERTNDVSSTAMKQAINVFVQLQKDFL